MSTSNIPDLDTVLKLGSVIGEGTFSTVYNGVFNSKYSVEAVPKRLAVKCITPIVEPQMLENELRCLSVLEGKSNVIQLLFAVRHQDRLALVMPYFEHEKFGRLIRRFKPHDVRDYMYQLLLSLNHIHSHRIIHRDIKPNNFLYSTKTTKCALVDFGLAELVPETMKCSAVIKGSTDKTSRTPLEDITGSTTNNDTSRPSRRDKPMKRRSEETAMSKATCNCRSHPSVCKLCIGTPGVHAARAGTAGYRPPEVLLKCVEQTTAVDMWACGIILLSILSGRVNFFNTPDDLTNLLQLVTLFGKEKICTAATTMGKNLLVDIPEVVPKATLKEICEDLRHSAKNKGFKSSRKEITRFPDSAFDLLEKLLTLAPSDRITASEALQHRFITSCSTSIP